MLNLDTPVSEINGVGKIINRKLHHLDIKTVSDLINYLPWRYEDLSQTVNIANLKIGQTANIVAMIELIQNRRSFKRKLNITESLISDDSGSLKVVWFNQPFIAKNLKPGDLVSLAGKLEEKNGQLILSSPTYEKISANSPQLHTKGLVPIYHVTAGLTQKQIRFLIKRCLPVAKELNEWLPANILKKFKLLKITEAINKIHFPKKPSDITQARQRFAFEKLFLRQLKGQIIRQQLHNAKAPIIRFQKQATQKFVSQLPFTLTPEQKQATWEILQDIDRDIPMTRLLEGDVGSGKTVVAVIAMFNAALNNQTSILMAPTEILAQQHYKTIQELLIDKKIVVSLYTRNYKESNYPDKDYTEADIIIGTHALIQKNSRLAQADLVIIDEQHRFGVEQRQTLSKRADNLIPHFLSMTATPIPRSLALAFDSHLNLSIIKKLPPGRQPIDTKIVAYKDQPKVYDFITKQIKAGRQAFVVCPLVDPSDKLGVKSVAEESQRLQDIFKQFNIDSLHGKMKGQEKEKKMRDFLQKKTDILVSTSVIELGIDVPNATIMVVEDAWRFGLAQLHQFRGRIGRGQYKSYCFLMLSDNLSDNSQKRLQAMVKHNNGFDLAEADLKMRGSGDMYGIMQSGFEEIDIAHLFNYNLIKEAQISAAETIKKDPTFLQDHLNRWKDLSKYSRLE